MLTKKAVEKVLSTIPDPEIGVALTELGLIYDVKVNPKKGTVTIVMTLTTIGCPLFSLIEDPIKREVGKLKGVKAVKVDLTFEPPWTPEKMSAKAKAELGMI